MSKSSNVTTADLNRVATQVVLKQPFYAYIMIALARKFVSDATPTMTIRASGPQNVSLLVNKEHFESIFDSSKRESYTNLAGWIVHNVVHLVYKHPMRRNEFDMPQLFDIASDISVNACLGEFPIPEGTPTIETFPDLKLEKGKTVDYYYGRLKEVVRNPEEEENKETAEQIQQMMSEGNGDHDNWSSFENVNGSEDFTTSGSGVLDNWINNLIKQAYKNSGDRGRGNLPGELQAFIEDLIQDRPPKLDWRKTLRLQGSSSIHSVIEQTRRRKNKRFRTYPGTRKKMGASVVLCVDTSGSVNDDDLREFFTEISHVARNNVKVTVLEIDTIIQAEYEFKRGFVPKGVHGRGGTDFNLGIERANQLRADLVVYFTDGYAPVPSVNPNMKCLWVICSDGIADDSETWRTLPGTVVKIDDND